VSISLQIIKEKTLTMGWKVYLVKCADNSLYCGCTNDLNSRIEKHNAGKGAKYTQSRLPVELVAVSRELSKSAALRLEHYIKQKPAEKKIEALKN
jgi:putative endonuclease